MKTILVIEDDDRVRENILDLLEAEEYQALAAPNGIEGVQKATQYLPDLIICDVMMPELDGYGVIQALRKNEATATIPFIFLTAKAEKTDTRKGMELGADDYLTKPFTLEELLKAISARLEKQTAIERESDKKLQQLRQNLVHAMPHELRTPLNGIISYSQMLMEECQEMDRAEIQEMAEGIYQSGQRLYRLVQNYLLYAEIELISNDKERLKILRAGIGAATLSTIATSANKAAKKFDRLADLRLDLADAPAAISAVHLHKIVEELVDNACKYSTEGSTILVLGIAAEKIYTLSVSNLGRGMSPEQIASLGAYIQFERKLYEQQGSGLGLTIAKRLAELYQGRLMIDSIAGDYTTVSVILPLENL
ncbi:MAG TPA: response regulator [Oscillatoriaceae cyanobacterium M33_DOE_052]|uniref:histidine kinase n=1 Tax=Planktothricoides sp. SpSt-374 TaxID=2282167 RepID=A0A7C3ZH02_9CYAN|nr:response regulator [Oscillatoriaceae cyanobacterium M33_DOE_052]